MGLEVGKEQDITCISRGGNPPAHLSWYKNGRIIPAQTSREEDMSKAQIKIRVEPSDNNAQYR